MLTLTEPTLFTAWHNFINGKKPSWALDNYAYDLEKNLGELHNDIVDKKYRHGGYKHLVITEKKRRDLVVATVRDRVLHRLLYDYLVDVFDKTFDPDVWSCRKGKGLHACLTRTQLLLRKHPKSFIWRADIKKFFDHVNHSILTGCIKRKLLAEDPALHLCGEVINSYPGGVSGIPIGNLTSQIFANIYLNEFDRFVRHILKPQAYIRYGDDFTLFAPSIKYAQQMQHESESFLQETLKLTVNPINNIIVPASRGLKFLGHDITDLHVELDRRTATRVIERVSLKNAASYKALALDQFQQEAVNRKLLEEIFAIYNK